MSLFTGQILVGNKLCWPSTVQKSPGKNQVCKVNCSFPLPDEIQTPSPYSCAFKRRHKNFLPASDLWQLGNRTVQQLFRGHRNYKNIHLIHLHNHNKNITWRFDYSVKFFSDHEKLRDFSRTYEKYGMIYNVTTFANLCG